MQPRFCLKNEKEGQYKLASPSNANEDMGRRLAVSRAGCGLEVLLPHPCISQVYMVWLKV